MSRAYVERDYVSPVGVCGLYAKYWRVYYVILWLWKLVCRLMSGGPCVVGCWFFSLPFVWLLCSVKQRWELLQTMSSVVREVVSHGRCGMGNLPSQGDVAELPGPVITLQTFWREVVTMHENARRRTCAFCFEIQSGKKLCIKRSKPSAKTAPAILELLTGQRRVAVFKVLGNIDMNMDTTPAIVCRRCAAACVNARRRKTEFVLSDAAIQQYSDAKRCTLGVPCHLCVRLGEWLSDNEPHGQPEEETKEEKKEEMTLENIGHKKKQVVAERR